MARDIAWVINGICQIRHEISNVYDIAYDVVCDINDGHNKYDRSAHHLRRYQISQHEWQVEEKNFDSFPSHVLSIMILYIHIVKMGCIV